MSALIQVDILVPDLVRKTHVAVGLRTHVPSQSGHRALAQAEREIHFLFQLVIVVIGSANLRCHQLLGVIAQAQARLDGVVRIFFLHKFACLVVIDVPQVDDTVLGLVVPGHACHLLEEQDRVHLCPGCVLATVNQVVDGRTVEVGCRVASHGNMDDQVAILLILVTAVVDIGTHRAFKDIGCGVIFLVDP